MGYNYNNSKNNEKKERFYMCTAATYKQKIFIWVELWIMNFPMVKK